MEDKKVLTVEDAKKVVSLNAPRTDFLRDEIVIVEYIIKPQPNITNPNHLAYGKKLTGTFDYIVPPKLRKDKMKNILTDVEKEGLEHILGRSLSIYGDFWKAYRKGGLFPIALGKDPLRLNLSVPEDYIIWKVLMNNSIIAKSWKQIEEEPRATYQYVMTHEKAKEELQSKTVNETAEAYAFYAKHANDEDALRYILRAVGKSTHRGQDMNFLTKAIGDSIDNAKHRTIIIKLAQDDLFGMKVFLEKAANLGVIDVVSGQYYTKEKEPIAGLDEEPTLNNAARFLSVKVGQEMRQAIEARIKNARE